MPRITLRWWWERRRQLGHVCVERFDKYWKWPMLFGKVGKFGWVALAVFNDARMTDDISGELQLYTLLVVYSCGKLNADLSVYEVILSITSGNTSITFVRVTWMLISLARVRVLLAQNGWVRSLLRASWKHEYHDSWRLSRISLSQP